MKNNILGKIKKGSKSFLSKSSPSLIAIAVGITLGLIIMLIFNPIGAFPAMTTLLASGFSSARNIGNVFYNAAPIILTGLAVAFAFKTGLFNIGASGQMMMGTLVAIYIAIIWNLPAPWGFIVATLGAVFGGFIWGLIPGLMKAFANVNEVVTSIMMNYIGGYLFATVVDLYLENANLKVARPVPVGSQLPTLSSIFPGSNANIGIFIAIVVAVLIHIVIHKMTLGYQLKASGFSVSGAKYAGMNTKLNIVIAMSISGMLAGLAGAVLALAPNTNISALFHIFPEGFDGISVSLIGLGEPIGVIFSGLFIGLLKVGTFNVQLYRFDENIMQIIQGIMIYAIAISVVIQIGLKKLSLRLKARKENKTQAKAGDE